MRSGCFLSRSCSSAKTFSSHFACFSATHLSTDFGLWPMKNSSPQPSHLSVPISWKPIVFSRLLFFIATARMLYFKLVGNLFGSHLHFHFVAIKSVYVKLSPSTTLVAPVPSP